VLSQESYITNLSLEFVEKRLIDRHEWAPEDAKEAVRRYKNFLILLYKYPHLTLAPAPDIDEAWHAHILFTKEYMRETTQIFGEYLHHTPALNSGSEEQKIMEDARLRAADLYVKEFNEPYFQEIDVSSFW
jgi:hypothetical protein